MYNETYHPLSEETLKGILNEGCWTESEKQLIIKQVEEATKNKTRNYKVTVDTNNWFRVENGMVPERRSNR